MYMIICNNLSISKCRSLYQCNIPPSFYGRAAIGHADTPHSQGYLAIQPMHKVLVFTRFPVQPPAQYALRAALLHTRGFMHRYRGARSFKAKNVFATFVCTQKSFTV
ncbi:MAG: hypothetical protein IJU23_00025 [Proteobacteria bacterium]|nr:hypothetical protein [Pseudomonadota bacterium]